MRATQAYDITRSLLDQHGLFHWRLYINARLSRALGRCHYRKRQIELSKTFLEQGDDAAIMDTILHEIAHALTPGDGHGKLWQAMARKLGAKPSATTSAVSLKLRYQLAYVRPDNTLELLPVTRDKRASLKGKMLNGRPETINKLVWIDAK